MIFSELYSAYYNAVAEILKKAVKEPINKDDIRKIVNRYAFSESIINIEPALVEEKWQLLLPKGTTPIKEEPKEKVNWKENQPKKAGLSFNEQKEYAKIEREIKDLEYKKKEIEDLFSAGTLSDEELVAKGVDLQKIIDALEEKEMRWFELLEKMES